MIVLWFVWFFLLLAGVGLSVWCELAVGTALTVLVILSPLTAAVFYRIISPKIGILFDFPKSVNKAAEFTGHIILQNNRYLLYRRATVTLIVANRLTGENQSCKISVSLYGKSTAEFSPECRVRYCGAAEVIVTEIRLYDCFGMTYRTLRLNQICEVMVLPEIKPVELTEMYTEGGIFDCDCYAGDTCGADLSELYDVREYLPGDSVRSVHWKLSQKHGHLLVKQGSQPAENRLCLALYAGACNDPERLAQTAEFAVSVSAALVEGKLRHVFLLDDAYTVESDIDLAAILPKLLCKEHWKLPTGEEKRVICIAAQEPSDIHDIPVVVAPQDGNSFEMEW